MSDPSSPNTTLVNVSIDLMEKIIRAALSDYNAAMRSFDERLVEREGICRRLFAQVDRINARVNADLKGPDPDPDHLSALLAEARELHEAAKQRVAEVQALHARRREFDPWLDSVSGTLAQVSAAADAGQTTMLLPHDMHESLHVALSDVLADLPLVQDAA